VDVLFRSQKGQAEILTATIIAQALRAEPDLVLGLATGRTMDGVYAQLVRWHQEIGLDFSRCRTFNLDEYIGLPPSHSGAFHRYMRDHLFQHVNLQPEHCQVPDGLAPDGALECQRYEDRIQAAGGIDLQLLGLGLTGHIGFNEPGSAFDSRTHEVRLAELTRQQNAEQFGGLASAVPLRAITMGLGTILEARRCLLLVTGADKAPILGQVLAGPVTPAVPGSVLRRHPHCTVIVDQAGSTGQ
jgi:glucosamine-6-phosphate deaminase